ncbi:MAG: flagellar motor protein MotB [Chloroflexi bacterium]|nr:flagellar motor protein MotB [Chloroflexota bacterium]
MAIKATARPEKDRSERWLLTYADLITLLMVFFVILYSFSIIDVKRFQDLKGSLDKAFNSGVLAGLNSTSLSANVSNGTVPQRIASADTTKTAAVASQLQKVADATGAGDQVTINQVAEGVTVSLSASLLFQSGTADLKPGAADLLKQIAAPLKDIPNPLEIIGNTDDVPPAATNSMYRDNFEVGGARAATVLRALVSGSGIAEDRLSTWSKGQYAPIAPNDTPENRAKNRRVDLLIEFPRPEDVPANNASLIAPAASPAPGAPAAAGSPAAAAKPQVTQQLGPPRSNAPVQQLGPPR